MKIFCFAPFLLVFIFCTALNAAAPPNVVVIFADDLGYGDLGAYGHPTIATPNLDRMAREGQKWTSFLCRRQRLYPHCPSSAHMRLSRAAREATVCFPVHPVVGLTWPLVAFLLVDHVAKDVFVAELPALPRGSVSAGKVVHINPSLPRLSASSFPMLFTTNLPLPRS